MSLILCLFLLQSCAVVSFSGLCVCFLLIHPLLFLLQVECENSFAALKRELQNLLSGARPFATQAGGTVQMVEEKTVSVGEAGGAAASTSSTVDSAILASNKLILAGSLDSAPGTPTGSAGLIPPSSTGSTASRARGQSNVKQDKKGSARGKTDSVRK